MSSQTVDSLTDPLEGDWNRLYIDGRWIDGGSRDTIPVEDPSRREQLAEVPAGTTDDVDAAFEAAAAAQDEWAATSPGERVELIETAIELLEEHQEDLRRLLTAESGSTHPKANVELDSAIAQFDYATRYPLEVSGSHKPSLTEGKENVVKREPAGTVTSISPWNYPFHLSVRAIVPALALGNTVVHKPATPTPIIGGLAIAEVFDRAGFPDGVFNVVTGHGSEIGDRIAGHPVGDVVAFTGSTGVGRRVGEQAAGSFAFPALELGGNCPFVVLEDADLDLAIDAGVFGTFLHQGQICMSVNRHIVHESLYDEYVERLVARAEALPAGNAHDPETIVGPVIDEGQRDEIVEYIEESVESGATLETGGGHDDLVVEPTVLSGVSNEMPTACNEHFGPVAPVISVSDDDEAIEVANDTEYGLSAAVICEDRARAQRVADGIDSGMVHINDTTVNSEPHIPFGGMKSSGIGRYYGEEMINEFTEPKWISTQHEPREYPF